MLSMVMRSDWRYLTRHAAEGRGPGRGEADSQQTPDPLDYYTAGARYGEPPGVWWGAGAESLELRGEVAAADMEALYGRLVEPATGAPLGSRPRRYASYAERLEKALAAEPDATLERVAELGLAAHKSHREARHYIDLTFSPSKSWSVLHAALEHAGRQAEAERVWAAWMAGVHAGLGYLMDEAGYSRTGYHGAKVADRTSGEWVDAHDFVVSLWRHHTSRDGDPQLHVHAAVLNRVRCPDGEWRTLDSRAIAGARVAAGAVAERVAEEELSRILGVAFRTRPDGRAREIVGVDPAVSALFSSRRRAITAGVALLAAAYQERHGHSPSAYTLRLMAEHVTLKTRARKPEQTPGREQLLDSWDRSVRRQLGGTLDAVLDKVNVDPERRRRPSVFHPSRVLAEAIADVERTKAVWTRHDLVAAVIRHLPDELGGLTEQQVRGVADELAERATGGRDASVVALQPPALLLVPEAARRADGRSRFEPHRPERFATAAQLEREESLLAAARQRGAPQLSAMRVEELLAASRLAGDQAAAVRAILTSGRWVDVLVGPPGTGKSWTMGQLVTTWREAFGAEVFGLAVSQNAVQVLQAEGIERGANVTQFLLADERLRTGQLSEAEQRYADRLRDGTLSDTQRRRYEELLREGRLADTERRFGLRPGTLLVIDEASMVTTADLARIVEIARRAKAKVLVTGDPYQLDAVGVGGGMRLLTERTEALVLTEVRRFAAEWEREASLGLRAGNAEALAEYDRHGRILNGSADAMRSAATQALLNDLLAGKSSLLIVGSNEEAASLSSRVRQQLIELGRVAADGVQLHNDTQAGVGDVIQSRLNNYRNVDKHGRPVLNRDVWRVVDRHADGSLTVQLQLGRDDLNRRCWGPRRTLDGDYVAAQVELAYVSTVHAALGRTVDSGHALVEQGVDRSGFLVPMTRGVESNVAYVVTAPDEDWLAPLVALLEREAGDRSATAVREAEFAAVRHLGRLGPVWSSYVRERAIDAHRQLLAGLLTAGQLERFDAEEASGTVYRLLRTAELDGADVRSVLIEAVQGRELESVDSLAQVLAWRIRRQLEDAARNRPPPTPDPADFVPRSYAERTPAARDELSTYVRQLAELMDQRVEVLAEQAAEAPPAWAEPLGPVPEDPLARIEWLARAGAVAAFREEFGQHSATDAIGRRPGRGEPERRAAWEQAAAALQITPPERELAGKTDAELGLLVESWRREQEWLPPNVDRRLRDASIDARNAQGRAVRFQAELEHTARDDPNRARVIARLTAAEGIAERLTTRAAELEEIASARTAAMAQVAGVQATAQAARQELDRRGIDADTLTPTHAPAEQESAATQPSEPGQSPMEPEQAPSPVPSGERNESAPVREETVEELEQRIETELAEAQVELDDIAARLQQHIQAQAPGVPEPAPARPERRTHYELDQDDRGRDPIHEGRDPRGEAAGAAEDQRRPADLAKARAARKLLAERAAERARAAKDQTPQPGSLAAALAKVRAEAQLRAEQAAQQAERKRQEQLATQVRPADHGRERD